MKKIKLPIMLIILLLITVACEKSTTHVDKFYNDSGNWDSLRLPLIKPYYLAYIAKRTGWVMPLLSNKPSGDMYYYYNLHGIEKISVTDGLIMIYTPYVEEGLDTSKGDKIYHWFVISPEKNSLEIGFENEDDFLEFIKGFGIQEVNWEYPNDLYKVFSRTKCLHWIPDCK